MTSKHPEDILVTSIIDSQTSRIRLATKIYYYPLASILFSLSLPLDIRTFCLCI